MRKLATSAVVAATLFAAAQTSHAALYYLRSAVSPTTDLNVLSYYNSNPDGVSGTAPTAMAGNQFSLNGYVGGTGSNAWTFTGASLDIAGGTLNLRNGNGFTKTFSSLIGTGNSLITANSGANPGTILSIGTFTANAGSTTTFQQLNGTTTTALSDQFTVGTLTGSGDIALDATGAVGTGGSRTILLTATTATAFTGNFKWSTLHTNPIALKFGNDLVSGGGLVASGTGARITLDHNVTFASVTLNGTPLSAGTHSYATLNASYDTLFTDGGSGSITVVPEPATLSLVGLLALPVLRRRSARN